MSASADARERPIIFRHWNATAITFAIRFPLFLAMRERKLVELGRR